MRLHQSTIEKALLSDNPSNQALGRLFATGIFDKFDQWLNAEDPNSADKAILILETTAMFGAYLLAGVLSEHFKSNEQAQDSAKNLFLLQWSALHDND